MAYPDRDHRIALVTSEVVPSAGATIMNRRTILTGLAGLVAAPAVLRLGAHA